MERKGQQQESSILVIDDDEGVLQALQKVLSDEFRVETSPSAAAVLDRVADFDLVLCDLMMPEMDGLAFLSAVQARGVKSTVIMMSAYGTTDLAIQAMKLGAYDYISKPFSADELILTIKKAEEREQLRSENVSLRQQITKKFSFQNIITTSQVMLDLLEVVKRVSGYKTTVLISGESGTGKELIARAIHYNSERKAKPFVAVNCGAIPENLLESELFGHKKGSFTDATRDKRGLFEEAQGGTLFLDEIGELPFHLQVKLLRVLQENEIRPVGDTRSIKIDVRIVAATLRDLEQDVLAGRFRDDLFYRLNVISLHVPSLKERPEDIPLLIEHFLKKNEERLKIRAPKLGAAALKLLTSYDWPGNIRELENCLERMLILSTGAEITPEVLPAAILRERKREETGLIDGGNLSIKYHSRVIEESLIKRALEKTGGNRTRAAKLLEISHRTLLYKLKEYALAEAGDEAIEEAGDLPDPLSQ